MNFHKKKERESEKTVNWFRIKLKQQFTTGHRSSKGQQQILEHRICYFLTFFIETKKQKSRKDTLFELEKLENLPETDKCLVVLFFFDSENSHFFWL